MTFYFWDLTPIYYKQPYLFYDLKKLIYVTDRAMNEVELDNSVNIDKAADALLIFSSNATERMDGTTNLSVPKRLLFFTRKLSSS